MNPFQKALKIRTQIAYIDDTNLKAETLIDMVIEECDQTDRECAGKNELKNDLKNAKLELEIPEEEKVTFLFVQFYRT